ncbi:MAG TPA: hypothetical protein VIU46_06680 [Gallionellaceae bacterium]
MAAECQAWQVRLYPCSGMASQNQEEMDISQPEKGVMAGIVVAAQPAPA